MSGSPRAAVLVIGIGNSYRSDDGAGLVAAQRLKKQQSKAFRVLTHSADGAGLMASWQAAEAVVLIDAVQSGAKAGTLYRWDANLESLPARAFRGSTHGFSVVEAIEMARVLGQLPQCLIVYGVEGQNFEAGTTLSPEVDSAVSNLVESVLREILNLT